jgi:tubulin-specific chaperone D
VRHGALLGLAAILPAHVANGANPVSLGVTLENQEQRQLAGLVADVERLRLLRGRGGELMRAALCRCITGLCSCGALVSAGKEYVRICAGVCMLL